MQMGKKLGWICSRSVFIFVCDLVAKIIIYDANNCVNKSF